MSNKVLQTTTAWKFFDLVRETCQRASWDTPEQWRAVAKRGLKKDLAIAMAGRYPVRWNDFTTLVIEVDEELQALKGQDSNTQSKKGTNTTNTNTNCTQEKCPDNSKFKLTDKEWKEHVKGNLCFKCHKKGHASKDCKSEWTIYSEVKKKKAVVASTTTTTTTTPNNNNTATVTTTRERWLLKSKLRRSLTRTTSRMRIFQKTTEHLQLSCQQYAPTCR